MGMMYFEYLCMYISDCVPPFEIPGSAPEFTTPLPPGDHARVKNSWHFLTLLNAEKYNGYMICNIDTINN